MAYDTKLAGRIRNALARRKGVTEKAMFGGLAFLLDGKMFVGIAKDELMVRVGPEHHEDAIAQPHARTMDFTGRPMKGYVFVAPAGLRTDEALAAWIERGRAFVAESVLGKPAPSRRAGRAVRGASPARQRSRRRHPSGTAQNR
jgi:TfoX/Sxy family transcriptional regulator of competence genes